ncbi:MAG: fumarylacetoacetate hydrolase family protein [Proteobacteria bacterium]|nr:fumarylacetoacetate hydrolase family protein [Pseudomonadota bacterium]
MPATFAVPPPPIPSVPVAGGGRFPVHRIYCIGRNYAAHAREMGMDPGREPPFFFMKPADAVVDSGADVPYPPMTANLHHEIELVVAIARGGSSISEADALGHVLGYGVGIDLTRRDLQSQAREAGRPWDVAKGFDHSAPCTAIHPQARAVDRGAIWLKVNGQERQRSDISQMIWSVPEQIAVLSRYFMLQAGDLIFTGTPEGVGPLARGDRVAGGVEGLDEIQLSIV